MNQSESPSACVESSAGRSQEFQLGTLVWDLVLVILQHVIRFAPAAEEAALDDFDDECCSFFLTHLRVKPSLEEFDSLSSEAGQPSVQHESH